MYDLAVPVARNALRRAAHLLDKIDASGNAEKVLKARLAPDMFACRDQFASGIGFALRATLPLAGREMPGVAYDADMVGLRKRLAAANKEIEKLNRAQFEGAATREIIHRAGFADLRQPGQTYLLEFAIPNMWFHLALAYAIMRAQGIDVGKADYDGLHDYPRDFSFDR
jgi:hypothetical protein